MAALAGVVWVFAIGTASARYELELTLRDATGQPLRLQPVLVWRYDYPIKELRTDPAGRLTVSGREQFATNVLTGPMLFLSGWRFLAFRRCTTASSCAAMARPLTNCSTAKSSSRSRESAQWPGPLRSVQHPVRLHLGPPMGERFRC